jgi:hypothetical protein
MAVSKTKSSYKTKYAMLKGYGNLAIPMDLVEEIASRGYIINTSYKEEGGEYINEVKPVEEIKIIDSSEIEAAIVQATLEGKK